MAEMNLSAAIREGAKTGPQAFGSFFGSNKSCCAYGAAWIGAQVGGMLNARTLGDALPALKIGPAQCPADHSKKKRNIFADIGSVVIHLNDDHGWTREAIADWLEQQGY